MADNNSNTSSDNSEPERELPGFSTLKSSEMEPRKKVSDKNYAQYLCQSKDVLNKQKFGHNGRRKCGRFFKTMETEEESFCCWDNSDIPEEYDNDNFVCVCVRVYKINFW